MVGRVVWGWAGVKLKPVLLSVVGIQSSHSQKCAVWPKYSAGSTSQATCPLKANCGLCIWDKEPQNRKKKYFEMHYTSKLRVIVCNSLENISHAVHSATEPQSTELWRSKCNLKLKKKKKVQRAEGRRVESCYRLCDSELAVDLGKRLISYPPIGSVWQKPPAIALDTYSSQRRQIKGWHIIT